jgi:hypothetical protein
MAPALTFPEIAAALRVGLSYLDEAISLEDAEKIAFHLMETKFALRDRGKRLVYCSRQRN